MAKQFTPVFNEQDLINIDNYSAYVKLMINGAISQGFNMAIYPPMEGNLGTGKRIKEISRLKYGQDREEIEKEILERSRIKSSGIDKK